MGNIPIFGHNSKEKAVENPATSKYHFKNGATLQGEDNLHKNETFTSEDTSKRSNFRDEMYSENLNYNVCNQAYSTENELKTHQETHDKRLDTVKDEWKCDICERTFCIENLFVSHIETHFGYMKCDNCGEKFRSKADMANHVTSHMSSRHSKLSACPASEKKFLNQSKLTFRFQQSHDLECDQCGLICKHKGAMTNHLKTHRDDSGSNNTFVNRIFLENGDVTFECSTCKNRYAYRRNLKQHIKTQHSPCTQKHKKTQRAQNSCGSDSNNTFVNKISLENGDVAYECSTCKKRYAYRRNLRKHIKNSQPGESSRYKGKQTMMLRMKEKTNDSKRRKLEENIERIKHKILKNRSGPCDSPVSNKLKFLTTFSCDYCGKVCKNKTAMATHVKKHMQLKPECSTYKKSKITSESNQALEFNIKTHMEQNKLNSSLSDKFQCDHCAEEFQTKEEIINHIKQHGKHKLPTSEKESNSQLNLNKNIMTNHFQCGHCQKVCDSERSIMVHIYQHFINRENSKRKTAEYEFHKSEKYHELIQKDQPKLCVEDNASTSKAKGTENTALQMENVINYKAHVFKIEYLCSNCDDIFSEEEDYNLHKKKHKHQEEENAKDLNGKKKQPKNTEDAVGENTSNKNQSIQYTKSEQMTSIQAMEVYIEQKILDLYQNPVENDIEIGHKVEPCRPLSSSPNRQENIKKKI